MPNHPIVSSLLTLAFAVSATAEVEDASSGRSPEPPEAAVIASVPFEAYDEPNRIMVNLAPEGSRPFPLMLDTGATYSVLTPGAARALGVSVRRLKSSPYRRATRLDRDLLFWVDTSLGDTRSRTGWDYALLSGFVVRLDYPRRRMWLRRESDEVRYLGFDYETFRTVGLMLYPASNQFVVVGVVPDSPAAAIGLRAGDALTQRFSDQPRTLQETVELVRAGGPVLVARLQENGVWVDTTLPTGAELADSPEARGGSLAEEREAMRDHAIESDARQAAEFERRRNEQLFYQTEGGGWMAVDFRMQRRGPQDGQEWVPFDEMQRRKVTQKRGETAGLTK